MLAHTGMRHIKQDTRGQTQSGDGDLGIPEDHTWLRHIGANDDVVREAKLEPPWPDKSRHLEHLQHFHDHDSEQPSDIDHENSQLPSRLKSPGAHDSSCQSPSLSSSECVTVKHHPSETLLLPGHRHCSLPEPVSLLEEVLSWRRTRHSSEHIRTKVIPCRLSEPRPNVSTSLFHPLPTQHCLSLTYILLLLLLGMENLSAHI